MKIQNTILFYFLPTLTAQQDDTEPLEDWKLDGLALNCGFENPTELSFEIFPGNVVLDTSTITANSCNGGDLQITEEAITENLPADQMDKGKKKFTVSYNPQTCMDTVGNPSDLSSYASNVTFELDFGYIYNDVMMHFRTYRIPASCKFQSEYNLKFNFGQVKKGVVIDPDTGIAEQPINGGIDFDIKVYKDSDLSDELFNTNAGMKSAQMVYFTITPKFNFPNGLKYAPPSCKFLQESCDAEDQCDVHNELELFNHQVNSCEQAPGSPLRFDISYAESNLWQSQFRLFLFGSDISSSTYTLRCLVDVCVAACSDSAVVGTQQCNAIAETCLSNDEFILYNDQCIQCGIGQQSNSAGDACEDCPENTYNDNSVSIASCIACDAGFVSDVGAADCRSAPNDPIRQQLLDSASDWVSHDDFGVMFIAGKDIAGGWVTKQWADAKEHCEALGNGVTLALPRSLPENSALSTVMIERGNFWVGIERNPANLKSSEWINLTGDAVSYTHWCGDRTPDHTTWYVSCASTWCGWRGGRGWANRDCAERRNFACEYRYTV